MTAPPKEPTDNPAFQRVVKKFLATKVEPKASAKVKLKPKKVRAKGARSGG